MVQCFYIICLLCTRYCTVTVFVWQLTLTAYDSMYPSYVAITNVTINVIRNPSAPYFTSSQYNITISEQLPLGSAVLQLIANDSDGVTIPIFKYFIHWMVIVQLYFSHSSSWHGCVLHILWGSSVLLLCMLTNLKLSSSNATK